MPITKVPGGERWLHEIRFDGYRAHIKNTADTAPAMAIVFANQFSHRDISE
jgi:hypothetical protein